MLGHHSNGRAMRSGSGRSASARNRHGFPTRHGGRAAACRGQVTALRNASLNGAYVGWRFSSIQRPAQASVTRTVDASTVEIPVRQNETAAGKLVRGAAP